MCFRVQLIICYILHNVILDIAITIHETRNDIRIFLNSNYKLLVRLTFFYQLSISTYFLMFFFENSTRNVKLTYFFHFHFCKFEDKPFDEMFLGVKLLYNSVCPYVRKSVCHKFVSGQINFKAL